MNKYIYSGCAMIILSIGIGIGYLLFHVNIIQPENPIEVVKPTETHFNVNTLKSDYNELLACAESPIYIDYKIIEKNENSMMVAIKSGDDCKYAETRWRINYPVAEPRKNFVTFTANIDKNDLHRMYYNSSYYRTIIGSFGAGGGISFDRKKILGGNAGIQYSF